MNTPETRRLSAIQRLREFHNASQQQREDLRDRGACKLIQENLSNSDRLDRELRYEEFMAWVRANQSRS
jgi:hypothetical protein